MLFSLCVMLRVNRSKSQGLTLRLLSTLLARIAQCNRDVDSYPSIINHLALSISISCLNLLSNFQSMLSKFNLHVNYNMK